MTQARNQVYAEINREFQEFLKADSVLPPRELTDRILTRVQGELNPNAWFVFSKMALIHFISGIFTLSICPQFGVRFFGTGLGAMKYFMELGRYGCMAACGAFLIGTSLFLAVWIFRREEVRKLREHRLLQVSAIVLFSLGALIMADAEIVLGFGIAWVFGSLAGGIAMLELSWLVRRRILGI